MSKTYRICLYVEETDNHTGVSTLGMSHYLDSAAMFADIASVNAAVDTIIDTFKVPAWSVLLQERGSDDTYLAWVNAMDRGHAIAEAKADMVANYGEIDDLDNINVLFVTRGHVEER